MPKFVLFSKRFYTSKDLITDRFGRLFHLPVQLGNLGWQGVVVAADYKNKKCTTLETGPVKFISINLGLFSFCSYLMFCFKMVRNVKPDVIIASSDTHFGLIGLVLARLRKIPLVFDVYDDYRVFASSKRLFMKPLFNYIVKKSCLVICASGPLKTALEPKNRSLIVIENGVDSTLFKKIPQHEARSQLKLEHNATIIGFFGAIMAQTGLDILMQSIQQLKTNFPRLKLLIAGYNYINFALDATLVDYRAEVHQPSIPAMINACDVAAMPYKNSVQNNASNPCKLAEYLACGVPIVATAISDIPRYFTDAPQALCIPGDVNDMVRAIKYQLREKKVLPFPTTLAWESLGKNLATNLARLCPAVTGSKS